MKQFFIDMLKSPVTAYRVLKENNGERRWVKNYFTCIIAYVLISILVLLMRPYLLNQGANDVQITIAYIIASLVYGYTAARHLLKLGKLFKPDTIENPK
jgi:uncharacterized membrane protein YGL010W